MSRVISNDYTIFSVYLSKIGNVCVAGLLFGLEFLENGGEVPAEFLDGDLLFGVFEGAVRLEGLGGFGDRQLVRQVESALGQRKGWRYFFKLSRTLEAEATSSFASSRLTLI